jgi:hypothetical protein
MAPEVVATAAPVVRASSPVDACPLAVLMATPPLRCDALGLIVKRACWACIAASRSIDSRCLFSLYI